jgi:hypothetical protein
MNYFLILKSYLHSRHFLIKVETEFIELSSIIAGIHQGSVLGLLLYLLYTADLPTSPESTTVTFGGTAVVATDNDPSTASRKLHTNLLAVQNWFEKWSMKANGSKLIHVPIHINKVQLPQEDVKYLGLHLDRRLTWHKHIYVKWK